MVDWIVNDLSLDGQYSGIPVFLTEFEALLATRVRLGKLGHAVSCARDLRYRIISEATTLAEAVHQMRDQARRNVALAWLAKGPFWVSPPEAAGVTYFHREDVTHQGLGEAARRRWLGEDARTFSFNGLSPFEVCSLDIQCLRDGADIEEVTAVPNVRAPDLETELSSIDIPRRSWEWLIDMAISELPQLEIARERAVRGMSRYPYDKGASDRIFSILKRLNDLANLRAAHGDSSTSVTEWLRVNVRAHGADFSSENPADRSVFTFNDPETGQTIYCPWHGKVHNPLQYRIHFQWPMPAGQTRLKVLYIGQKLTKN